jgi:hypothetical protein
VREAVGMGRSSISVDRLSGRGIEELDRTAVALTKGPDVAGHFGPVADLVASVEAFAGRERCFSLQDDGFVRYLGELTALIGVCEQNDDALQSALGGLAGLAEEVRTCVSLYGASATERVIPSEPECALEALTAWRRSVTECDLSVLARRTDDVAVDCETAEEWLELVLAYSVEHLAIAEASSRLRSAFPHDAVRAGLVDVLADVRTAHDALVSCIEAVSSLSDLRDRMQASASIAENLVSADSDVGRLDGRVDAAKAKLRQTRTERKALFEKLSKLADLGFVDARELAKTAPKPFATGIASALECAVCIAVSCFSVCFLFLPISLPQDVCELKSFTAFQCGHWLCTECADALIGDKCPVCRARITGGHPLFL